MRQINADDRAGFAPQLFCAAAFFRRSKDVIMETRSMARNRVNKIGWLIGALIGALGATARAVTVTPGETVSGSAFMSAAKTMDALVASETKMYTIMDGTTPVSTGTVTSEVFRAAGTGDLTFVYDIGFTSDAGSYELSNFAPSVSTDVNFINVPQDASVSVSRDLGGLLSVDAGVEPPDLAGDIMITTDSKSYSNTGNAMVSGATDTFVGSTPTEVSGSASVSVFEPSIPLISAADGPDPVVPLPPAAWMGLAGIAVAIAVQTARKVVVE
jgi:hypothetical protein